LRFVPLSSVKLPAPNPRRPPVPPGERPIYEGPCSTRQDYLRNRRSNDDPGPGPPTKVGGAGAHRGRKGAVVRHTPAGRRVGLNFCRQHYLASVGPGGDRCGERPIRTHGLFGLFERPASSAAPRPGIKRPRGYVFARPFFRHPTTAIPLSRRASTERRPSSETLSRREDAIISRRPLKPTPSVNRRPSAPLQGRSRHR